MLYEVFAHLDLLACILFVYVYIYIYQVLQSDLVWTHSIWGIKRSLWRSWYILFLFFIFCCSHFSLKNTPPFWAGHLQTLPVVGQLETWNVPSDMQMWALLAVLPRVSVQWYADGGSGPQRQLQADQTHDDKGVLLATLLLECSRCFFGIG